MASQAAAAAQREALATAREAGLRYVADSEPGIRRERHDGGWRYWAAAGAPVSDAETLARIRGLTVPPAWTDVWICIQPNGHIQATGRDARGRKQYRYHPRWRAVRDQDKFERVMEFVAAPQQRLKREAKTARRRKAA